MDLDTLIRTARSWAATDPDPATRAATLQMIEAQDEPALRVAFGGRLQFGTAGIRGKLGPGPQRMNRALVRRVSGGLAAYLLANDADEAREKGVVIGYDGRHGSREFAEDTAQVLGGLGIPSWLFDTVQPTPVTAHAVLHLGAVAGVMVTASHNPPQDNGYKVYWSNGAQIVPPHDSGISAAIDAVEPTTIVAPTLDELRAIDLVRDVPDSAWADYLQQVLALRVHTETGARAVYTAMHGVGRDSLCAVLAAAGHEPLIQVAEQCDPDADFPTVSFPNPEEPGALDLALAKATATNADLIIAHDPDADRLAVAIPDEGGGWRALTGNDVGLLLADDLLTHGPAHPDRLVATTIVSSSMLATLAAAHGARHAEVLTGFKWIANKAIDHTGPFVMGFEEALGYSIGEVVRDKDGVSAALVFLDMASWCKARGVTLLSHLTELYRRHGYVASGQRSVVLPGSEGAAAIRAMMTALRSAPPTELGGYRVRQIRDVQAGTATDTATGAQRSLDLPTSNVLAYDLDGGHRVLVRPSGTEPKIKFYFEAREALSPTDTLADGEARAQVLMDALADDTLRRAGAAG